MPPVSKPIHKGKYRVLERLLFPRAALDRERLVRALDGKTVLVTGASSGIGERVAYLLAECNVHLILVARREERLAAIKHDIESRGGVVPVESRSSQQLQAEAKHKARVSVFAADLRDEGQLDGLLEYLHRQPAGLDVVVSNAGHSIRRPISESLERYHDFTRTMAINYLAPVRLLLSILPLLSANDGQVVNISTASALLPPIPRWAAYHASKAAMDIWFRSAAPELQAMGVTASSLYLPLVRTPMIEPTATYRKLPAMSADHAAELVCRSMYTRKKRYKPWWLFAGELSSLLFRRYWEWSVSGSWRKRGGSS